MPESPTLPIPLRSCPAATLDAAPITHVAYIRVSDRWCAAGSGHIDEGGHVLLQLDVMPSNPEDFTGHICLSPLGKPPGEEDLRKCQALARAMAASRGG